MEENRLQFWQGLEAGRKAVTPAAGVPIWVTDTKEMYVGDGATPGGIEVTGVKRSGDDMTGWLTIHGARVMVEQYTVFLDPAGSPTPANPWAGDAFNSLTAARNFLGLPAGAPLRNILIKVAPGTYTESRVVKLKFCDIQLDSAKPPGPVTFNINGAGDFYGITFEDTGATGFRGLTFNITNATDAAVGFLGSVSFYFDIKGKIIVNAPTIPRAMEFTNATGRMLTDNRFELHGRDVAMHLQQSSVRIGAVLATTTTNTARVITSTADSFTMFTTVNAAGSANGVLFASDNSVIIAPTRWNVTSTSPAVGVLGNKNSLIIG